MGVGLVWGCACGLRVGCVNFCSLRGLVGFVLIGCLDVGLGAFLAWWFLGLVERVWLFV